MSEDLIFQFSSFSDMRLVLYLLWLCLWMSSGDATSKKRDLAKKLAQTVHSKHKSRKASKKAKKNPHYGHQGKRHKAKKAALGVVFLILGGLVVCLCCLFGLGVFGYKKLWGNKSEKSQRRESAESGVSDFAEHSIPLGSVVADDDRKVVLS